MLAEIAVDSELVALDKPVDREPIPLTTVERPVDVDEETELMPLAIVDRLADVAVLSDDIPVDSDDTPVLNDPILLVTVDKAVLVDVLNDEMPVEADVDSDDKPCSAS